MRIANSELAYRVALFEQVEEELKELVTRLLPREGASGSAHHFGTLNQIEKVRPFVEKFDQTLDESLQANSWATAACLRFFDSPYQLARRSFQERNEEFFFVAEVAINSSFADLRFGRDILHPNFVEAMSTEQPAGGIEHLVGLERRFRSQGETHLKGGRLIRKIIVELTSQSHYILSTSIYK